MKRKDAVIRPVGVLFSGSLLGKLLGAGREILLAASYGTSAIGGAFRVANTATFIPVNFLTADSLNAAFMPLYVRYGKDDRDLAQTLFWSVAGLLGLLAVLISVLLFWGAGRWAAVLAPGLDEGVIATIVAFIRVMAMGVPFYVAGALFSSLEMGNGGYGLASLRTCVQNIGIIGGILLAWWLGKPVIIAWGFSVAYVVFALWGALRLTRRGMLSWPEIMAWSLVRQVLSVFGHTIGPLLFLPLFLQGNIALERAVASLIGLDVVSALDYAKFITETGVILLAVPIGLVGLSTLSGLDPMELNIRLAKIVPPLLIITIPLSVFLFAYSKPIVCLLYARGAFDAASVMSTTSVLKGLSLGFWAQVCGYVLMKVLNTQLRNREVLLLMILALSVNALNNFLCYRMWGAVVLGVGTSLYGVVLFVFGSKALKIGPMILRVMGWMALGVVLYLPICIWLPSDGLLSFLVAGLVFLVFWASYVVVVPQLRNDMVPIVSGMRRRSA